MKKRKLKIIINLCGLITIVALILMATFMVVSIGNLNAVMHEQCVESLRNDHGVENNITKLEDELKQQQSSQIQRIAFVTVLLIVIVLFLFYLISNKLKKDLDLCLGLFDQLTENKKLKKDQICFVELSQIAENVEAALRDKKTLQRQHRTDEQLNKGRYRT